MREKQKQNGPTRGARSVPAVANTGEELGEGNRTAAKRYNQDVRRTVETKDVERLAEEAADALDGPEAEELREAEEKGKRPAKTTGPAARAPSPRPPVRGRTSPPQR